MESTSIEVKTGRAPATMVGGRRKSQPMFVPTVPSEEEEKAMDARGPDGEEIDANA
ncbi:hypothetical protein GGI16_003989, partial [Coemansia sp. S142-1]